MSTMEFKEAVLGMSVTPRILADARIELALQISQNMPGRVVRQGDSEALAIDKQEITTQVTLADGDTAMLGGIFQYQRQVDSIGFPGLPMYRCWAIYCAATASAAGGANW